MHLAPIVLFVYNRPWHTQQTVEALQKNELANESELFIYSDAAKNENAKAKVNEVREYIKNIDGFKKVKIIVLEDDLVTSPYFLKFMNEALEFYKDEERVWHVSGWNYPIDIDRLEDLFLWRLMNCWGWATWADRWKYYEKNVNNIMKEFSKDDIKRFNIDGVENFWGQVLANKTGKINTWAIFWYVAIFKQNGLCLNPSQTFVENIGHDGSGVHCGDSCAFSGSLSMKKQINFDIKIEENSLAVERIQQFYKSQQKSFFVRAINKLARVSIGKNIIR